jgi:branched-chain amino acid transport system substrate-binding protein
LAQDKVTRRKYLQTVGAGVGGLVVGSVLGYGISQSQAPSQPTGGGQTQTTAMTSGTSGPPISEINVGVIEMFTGGGADTSQEIKRIYDQYVGDYNAAGGVQRGPLKGATIKLTYSDTQTNVEVGRSEAERLVTSNEVCMLVGCNWTSQTIPVKTVTDQHGFPLVNSAASNIKLTLGANNQWFWRPGPHDQLYLQRVFNFLKDLQAKTNTQVKTLGLMYINDNVGIAWHDYLVNTINKDPNVGGYNITSDIPIVSGTPAFDSEVLTLKKNVPDVFLMFAHAPDEYLITKELRQYDVNAQLVVECSSEILDQRYIQAVGNLADGIASRSVWSVDLARPDSQAFDAKYKAKWGYDIGDGSGLNTIQAVVKTFENLPEASLEPKVIQQACNSLYISAADSIMGWGTFYWPPGTPDAGQNMLASANVLQWQLPDLSIPHTVWPWANASKDVIFPVKSWTARGL